MEQIDYMEILRKEEEMNEYNANLKNYNDQLSEELMRYIKYKSIYFFMTHLKER